MESTSKLPQYVVDASVAMKWHVRDEPLTDLADATLLAYRNDLVQLLAPDCLWYEVAGAIRKALRTGRVTTDDARDSVVDFAGLRIPTFGSRALIVHAYDFALRYGCSFYDGVYLALAEAADCPCLHADYRLRNALAGRFTRELWLEDWSK
ncbi:MAG TPA: type II toxin-antitoxin system VapC family toxin [Thermomicrobiales bacterium]|nr:type II toxin-antitoxin system VapC family toxin [Thermomicrobiales bacterium]